MTNLLNFDTCLNELIATASVSSTLASQDMSNKNVIALLANWFEDLGCEISIQDIPGHADKQNLVAKIGSGDKGLIFSGHSDTVPFDENRWESDPFIVKECDDHLYGLGCTDMKGFFAVIIKTLQSIDIKKLQHPIYIVATADEECSMLGAKALKEEQFNGAEFAIIGEPTSLRPIHMHKGIMMDRIRISGKSGHSSNPNLGNNALDAMQPVIKELQMFRAQLQAKWKNTGFAIAQPTLNLGCIHGGDNPNRICGNCALDFDIRPIPGMQLSELRNDIDKRMAAISDELNIDIQRETLFDGIDAFSESEIAELTKLAETFSGHFAESVAYATEAPYFKKLGMQTLVLGPGSIDQAHQPNEFLHRSQIDPAVKIYQKLIQQLCMN